MPRPRTRALLPAATDPGSVRSRILRQSLDVIALIRERPMQRGEIAAALSIPDRTVNRILTGLSDAELELTCETRGRERYYSLPPDTLRRALP